MRKYKFEKSAENRGFFVLQPFVCDENLQFVKGAALDKEPKMWYNIIVEFWTSNT